MVDEPISGLPALPEDVADERLLPVFVFGELFDAEFFGRLLEHPVVFEPARLVGYRIAQLAAFDWPILVLDDDETVSGSVCRGVEAADLRRIDAYHGVEEGLYRREAVSLRIGEEGAVSIEEAFVYLPTDRTLRRASS